MNPTVLGVLLVVWGYLSGSISWGVVLARVLLGVDLRTVGSGNIGATNVARAGGKGLGVAVLLLDAAKAIVPTLVSRWLLAGTGAEVWTLAVAIAAFLGHLYPIWLLWRGGKGGKGVATALGIFVVLAPWAALAGLVTYGVAYALSRISSVGSLAGSVACVAGTFVTFGWRSPEAWTAAVIGALIVLRHRENIRRLVRGEEKKMKV